MYEFHSNTSVYFQHQSQNAHKYVIPFIEAGLGNPLPTGARVLEIGCGEGGVLLAFLEKGCVGVGVELSDARAAQAAEFLDPYVQKGQATIVSKNIYDIKDVDAELGGRFDVVVLKDVIEHIHDQARFMRHLQEFLTDTGVVFFGFPPWQMPYGGHQQICKGKILSKLPYYHLLPAFLYKGLLKLGGETPEMITALLEIKETGISIERFERILKQTDYQQVAHTAYLVNPIYEYKFKLRPRKQAGWVRAIPYLRNFLTTCVYYLVRKK